jgi:hypothetical protein
VEVEGRERGAADEVDGDGAVYTGASSAEEQQAEKGLTP